MVFGVGHVKLEPLERHAGTERYGRSVAALAVAALYLHLRRAQGVVSRSDVELLAQQQVGAQNEVLAQSVLPVVEPYECGRES